MAVFCIISNIERYIGLKSQFVILNLHSTPPLGGPRWNIAIMFGVEKLEWRLYQIVKTTRT